MRSPIFERFLNDTHYKWHADREGYYSVRVKGDRDTWIQVPQVSARFTTGEATPTDLAQILCSTMHSGLARLVELCPRGIRIEDVPRMTDYFKGTDLFSELVRWRMENCV